MEHIFEADDSFPFQQLQFISPSAIPGGNYFIRCLTGKQTPLYIQPPKCYSKNGLVKTGKRMYIDLVYSHDDEQFIEWVEKLENLCQTKIFDNREKWFESGLEMHDIENSFTPSMKIYKSGKMYIVRANIPVRLGKCGLKIYDEQENDVDPEKVNEKMKLMTILEIQGIKCSARNFQLEFEVKQMMTLNPSDLFESCVFSKSKKIAAPDTIVQPEPSREAVSETETETETENESAPVPPSTVTVETVEDDEPVTNEEVPVVEPIEVNLENLNHLEEISNGVEESKKEVVDLETLEEFPIPDEKPDGLCEIDFPLDENPGEVMQLKPRNDVYFEMYQNAKRKANIARDIALSAYLEAKQIKNTYLIHEDIDEDEEEKDEKNEQELKNIEKTIEDQLK